MGRKKVVLKRIEDKSSRQVTFTKRRNGLIKKARELSILCDVEVALIIFSSRGKLYEFAGADSLAKVLEHYWSHSEEAAAPSKGVNDAKIYGGRFANLKSHTELLQVVQRNLKGPNLDHVTPSDLLHLEKQLGTALSHTRARKMQLMLESVKTLRIQERMLREENELLRREIAAMMNGGDTNEMAIGHIEQSNHHLVHPSQHATLSLF